MEPIVNRFPTDPRQSAGMSDCFTEWYAANESIRRLWAVEDRDSLIVVFIALEPTSDGDDALPVWLAKSSQWANELAELTRRDVQLQLLNSNELEQRSVSAATTVAALSWRDPWLFE
ncbi:hypothetical protein [Steroidobacter cummioxidans]|uniref:hypothetical protein n=1 Tax=Steroidobacter cummioxidans TaxID=1803913 RepID=UPI000E30E1EA|nr:hypothetical protein [Steroidobacter cummioxidans]